MTARQPKRARRRSTPATALPRPGAADSGGTPSASAASSGATTSRHHREHHVTRDYSHVHKDLLTVLVVGMVVLGFIVGMSFVV